MLKIRLNLPKEERHIIKKFCKNVFIQQPNTEHILYNLFQFPKSFAKNGLENKYLEKNSLTKEITFFINFYFGSEDWMDSRGA